MLRLQRNEQYYFIGNRTYDYKVCQTTDCYFPTDQERWDAGNYFYEAAAAKACAAEIKEQHWDNIRALEREKDENKRVYIGEVTAIAVKAKRPRLQKEDMQQILAELVAAQDAYTTRRQDITKALADIDTAIAEQIKNANKL